MVGARGSTEAEIDAELHRHEEQLVIVLLPWLAERVGGALGQIPIRGDEHPTSSSAHFAPGAQPEPRLCRLQRAQRRHPARQ